MLLPDEGDAIEFQSEWQMGTVIHPEATYLLFPFNIPGAQARIDTGVVPIRPHLDQIPGTCRDYFTVQGWVDLGNEELGVTIATPENPMVQLGDFHFAHNQSEVHLERAMFLGWVTNNYWETNFPGMQPGTVTAHYHILPYRGKFDEARAHRFGAEAAHSRPVIQHLGEQPAEEMLPPSGTLLHLPDFPVLSLSLRNDPEKGMLLTLFNASDIPQVAVVKSGIIRILAASCCDIFRNPLESIEVKEDALNVTIEPRRIATLSLES
jgi:hypothetical protein